jgi:MOSC domain-containing protein YiiM
MRLCSVQTGKPRRVAIGERNVMTAIHKSSRSERVAVAALGLEGDEQVDLTVHGGLEKAVYAYPESHYAFWKTLRNEAGLDGIDADFPYGSVGENLTLAGLLETEVWIGDRLVFPDCVLRVTQPREPCFKFNAAMGFNTAVRQMVRSGHCGFYLAVEKVGSVAAGEAFSVLPGSRQTLISEQFQTKMRKHLR